MNYVQLVHVGRVASGPAVDHVLDGRKVSPLQVVLARTAVEHVPVVVGGVDQVVVPPVAVSRVGPCPAAHLIASVAALDRVSAPGAVDSIRTTEAGDRLVLAAAVEHVAVRGTGYGGGYGHARGENYHQSHRRQNHRHPPHARLLFLAPGLPKRVLTL